MGYHEGKIVIADRNLNQAVRNALSGNIEPERRNVERGRNSMSDGADAVGMENVGGYNSFFKIVDRTETNEDGTKTFKIGVIDGAPFHPLTGDYTGRSNVFLFNGAWRNIFSKEGYVLNERGYYYVYLVLDTRKIDMELSDPFAPAILLNVDKDLSSALTARRPFYLIGIVHVGQGYIVINQCHQSGVPHLLWFGSSCSNVKEE